MQILELPEIPREREKLRGIIAVARYEHRKSVIIRYTAYAIMVVSLMIVLYTMAIASSDATQPIINSIYLPMVQP